MKKNIFAAILAGLVICTAVACSKTTTENNDDSHGNNTEVSQLSEKPQFQMLVKDYPISVTDKNNEGLVYVSGTVRKASVVAQSREFSDITKNINSVLLSAYNRNKTSGDEILDIVSEAFTTEGFDVSTAMFPWSIDTNYELVNNNGTVVTVKETVDYFAGGPHHTVSTYYYNFDCADGKHLAQILYTEGDDAQRDAADELIYNKLKEKYGEDVINYDYIQSSFVEAAVDTWYFTENGINVYFNQYEIAPYAAGDFEIEITKAELPEAALKYFEG